MVNGCAQINAWQLARGGPPYPPGYRLGLWTPPRGPYRQAAYSPSPLERAAVGRDSERLQPYWFVVNATLASRESQDVQVTPQGSIALLWTAATQTAGGSFRAQVYQVFSETGAGHRFSRDGLNNANIFGTAQRPSYLRHPYWPPTRQAIQVRLANSTTATNTVQAVFLGLRRT